MSQTKPTGAPAPATSPIEACRTVFGEYPGDILSVAETADEAIGWFHYLFHKIKKLSKFERSDDATSLMEKLIDIGTLSGMGDHLSFDIGEYVRCEAEKMAEHIRAAEANAKEVRP
jgi:hypothetical protein